VRGALGVALASLAFPGGAAGQVGASATCGDVLPLPLHELADTRSVLARAMSVTARAPGHASEIFRSSVRTVGVCADSAAFLGAWADPPPAAVQLAPAETWVRFNSAYPRDRNNGVMWAGVGANAQLQGGAEARWRWLSGALIPKLVHHPNGDHASTTLYTAGRIDLPKRFGEEPFTVVDAGQSFVAAVAGPVEARLSHENLWLGPAQLTPILLSNTAGGFPHVRVGTARPLDIRIGHLEAAVFWGSLSESDYFDLNPDNDSHLFTGSVIVLEPRFLPGLHVGGARVYHDPARAGGHDLGFYLGLLWESPLWVSGGNREGNAIGALFARWVLPDSDFEVYLEWARDDTPYNLQDLIREPDWTQAYVFGFQKVFVSDARLVRFYGEVAHLGESTPVRAGKGHATFYTHGTVPQGHTHGGQMLGAGIGVGSDSRSLGVDWFDSRSRTGVWLEHVRYDEDTYYRTWARIFGESRHNVELTAEARHVRLFGPLQAELVLRYSRQYDRDFIPLLNDQPPTAENNWGVEAGVRWRPPWVF
jgi:hypothetical protein